MSRVFAPLLAPVAHPAGWARSLPTVLTPALTPPPIPYPHPPPIHAAFTPKPQPTMGAGKSKGKKGGVAPKVAKKSSAFAGNSFDDKVEEMDRVSIAGLTTFAEDVNLTVTLHHENGSNDTFEVAQTLNSEQIGWFKAGSALNLLREASA